jgi:uncharacterized protein YecE (DUF72 family)
VTRRPARIGCSGWQYQSWRETFYPPRLPAHMKRLADMDRGAGRYYESIAPLVESPKLGPVLWQLPDSFRRDDDRLAHALSNLPPGRHAFELRHPSRFAEPVHVLLREHGAAFVIHDDRRRRAARGPQPGGVGRGLRPRDAERLRKLVTKG